MRLLGNNGNLGIGTAAPQVLLDAGGASSNGLAGLTNPTFYTGYTNTGGMGGIVAGAGANGNSPFIAASKDGNGNALSLFFQTNGTIRQTIDTSGLTTFSNDIRVDRGSTIDGIVGQAYSGYFGLKHADQTINSEYMIISQDFDTYISCSSGSSVRIRPNANNSSHELLVTTNVTLAKAAFGAGRIAIDPDSYTAYSGGFGSINDGGSWGASGMWVHGGGTGDAAAIAHNGSNLYFGLQNGSAANSMATYMMIEPTGNICMEKNVKLTGTVLRRSQHQTGHFEGSYNNVGANDQKTNPIYTIGSSYNPAESTLANMYGIGYSHSNASFTPSGVGWGMYVAANGVSRIYLSGENGSAVINGSLTQNASDIRLKTNIKVIANSIEKIKKIRGITFDWVDDITSKYGFFPSAKHETGVIAQEIQDVIPDAVVTAPFNHDYTEKSGVDDNFLTVKHEKIIPLFIEAIKELATKVEALETEVAALKGS